MQKVFVSIVCFITCAVMATAQGGKDKEGKGEFQVEGTWKCTAGIREGMKLPDADIQSDMLAITFKEGKYTVWMGKEVFDAGTCKIDAKQKPAYLDLMSTEGPDKGKTQLGLIKVDGDVMTIALHAKREARPKDFEGRDGFYVAIFKRGK